MEENDRLFQTLQEMFMARGQDLGNFEACPSEVLFEINEEFHKKTGMLMDELFYKLAEESGLIAEYQGSEEDFEDWVRLYNLFDIELKKCNLEFKFSFYEDFHGERDFGIYSQSKNIIPIIYALASENRHLIRNEFVIYVIFIDSNLSLTGEEEKIIMKPLSDEERIAL
ncbi:hypothetical protein AAHN93_14160 [Vandammella animalimorsus]|uniref:hypothetical protein n=1 Tax=Vandammella animalimorsus TaxID=2029117 RepID=UPI0031BA2B6C